ncbi:MAG TPA: APC family permease [Spirillospora sp.]|nr:APC family permease [Spirillospora sp.]
MAIPEVVSPSSSGTGRRRIGVPEIVFFVVAASAPLTVAAGGLPTSFAVTGVVGIPLLYVILAVLLAVFTGGYAAMSRSITNAGAFYAYITHGLGRAAGVGAAFVALISYNTMQIGLYGLFGFTTADLLKSKTGLDLPWWTVALLGVAVVAVLGFRRIDLNARVLGVLLAVEFLTVLVFDLAQLADAPSGVSLAPLGFRAASDGAVGAAFCFAMASFMGFEAAALYSEECRDPRRTISRATYIAVAVIGVFYAFTAWAMTVGTGTAGIIGRAQKDGPGLVFALAGEHVGKPFADLAQLFLVTSLFAALLSFHNAVARYFFSLGREGVLPAPLSRTHDRHGSPHIGSLTQTVLAAVVVTVFAFSGKDPVLTLFNWFTNLGALGVILLLALTSAAVVAYFARDHRGENAWNRLIAPAVACAGLGAVFVASLLNFDALLGAEKGSALTWALPGLIFAAAALGVAFALYLRLSRPASYARIGTSS